MNQSSRLLATFTGVLSRYWNQSSIQSYLKAPSPISSATEELTFTFYYAPNENGPLESITDDEFAQFILSIATDGELGLTVI